MSYYDAWEPGVFPYQEALCHALNGTVWAIEDPPFNPVTIRLVGALRATERLAALLECPPAPPAAVDETEVPTLAWIIDRPVFLPPPVAKPDFPAADVQAALLGFSSALTGALDRVAWEIDLLTTLAAAAPGWRALRRPRTLSRLRRRMPALAAWVEGATATPLDRTFELHAWFTTAGFVPMAAESAEGGRRWRPLVPRGRPKYGGAVDTDALQLTRVLLREACTVFNGVYHMLNQRVQHEGPPPWD